MDLEAIHNKYKASFDYYNIKVYNRQPSEDILLTKWWADLMSTEDMNSLIVPDSQDLRSFLNIFTPPVLLFYQTDKSGAITQTFWLTPVDSSSKHRCTYAGFWTSPNHRGTLSQLIFTALVYSVAFEVFSTIIGVTWQKELLEEHQKLGYNVGGIIPNMYDKEFCYIVYLQKDKFFNSRMYQVYKRKIQRS